MRNYIIADNQELTAYALQSLLKRDEGSAIFRAVDRAGLTELLKEHEDAVVFLDYTLFDFADEDQLLIVAERFSLSEWILISDELTPQFVRRVVYSSHQFSLVFKDGPMSEIREALQSVNRHTRYLSQRALETIISQQQEEEKPDILTSTETEIIKAIAQGKTTKEIAAERFSSIHTVTTHRQEYLPKTGHQHSPRSSKIYPSCRTDRSFRILYMSKAQEIVELMESQRNDAQRQILMGFFKTGPGEYGFGDEFLGLKVPQTREVVKAAGPDFPLSEVPILLKSRWHEVRLCGFLILVAKFEKLATKRLENNFDAIKKRDEIVTMYLQYAEQANNWDLVDLSVHKILGHWLLLPSNLGDRDYKIKVLDSLAQSPCLWKQRMSIVCSWKTSQMGDPSWCLRYAEIHLHHPHDLMHKAVGWMLREMGKRVSMDLLREFLRQHAYEMPRTMLRYAIEKMSEKERKEWMSR